MAERKYDMALVQTVKDRVTKIQPWYKERIRTRYIKSLQPGEALFKNLNGKNWRFVKSGLDDFRDGLPPKTGGQFQIMPTSKGVGPNIHQKESMPVPVQRAGQRGRFTKEQIAFSKLTPIEQQRKDGIEEVELGLIQHPLALYPHLEESLPAELFEDIVNIVDPQLNVKTEDISQPDIADPVELNYSIATEHQIPDPADSVYGVSEIRNPYYWLPKREDPTPTPARKKYLERKERSKMQERHIHKVTEEFCDWVSQLGGESNNIEEATISSLFASGYETKPAITVPIHVVEISNVPSELKISAKPESHTESDFIPDLDKFKKPQHTTRYQPSWSKFHYGAWYLLPQTWKKREYGSPLRDPQDIKQEELRAEHKKNEHLNRELAEVHGTTAFMSFLDRKNSRRPEFLDEIAVIQKLNAEEEKRRLEEEHLAKMKRFPNVNVMKKHS